MKNLIFQLDGYMDIERITINELKSYLSSCNVAILKKANIDVKHYDEQEETKRKKAEGESREAEKLRGFEQRYWGVFDTKSKEQLIREYSSLPYEERWAMFYYFERKGWGHPAKQR